MDAWIKTIKYSHDDLENYSQNDIDLLAKKYLPDTVVKDKNDILWLLAIEICGKYKIGHMDPSEIKTECLKGYQIKQLLGKGTYGSVYNACLDDDCTFAVKFMNTDTQTRKDTFFREGPVTKEFSENGIGPKYYGHWLCDNNIGIIVTEQWDGSLNKLPIPVSDCIVITKELLDKLENIC